MEEVIRQGHWAQLCHLRAKITAGTKAFELETADQLPSVQFREFEITFSSAHVL